MLPRAGCDLDPFVHNSMKLGSFLLFTKAEIGTVLTDNVLARASILNHLALEFAPNVRLKLNWSRHFFSAEFDADGGWCNDFSVEDDRTTSYDLSRCISAAKDSSARWLQLNLDTVSEESASMSRVTAAWWAPHCCDDFSAKIVGC